MLYYAQRYKLNIMFANLFLKNLLYATLQEAVINFLLVKQCSTSYNSITIWNWKTCYQKLIFNIDLQWLYSKKEHVCTQRIFHYCFFPISFLLIVPEVIS